VALSWKSASVRAEMSSLQHSAVLLRRSADERKKASSATSVQGSTVYPFLKKPERPSGALGLLKERTHEGVQSQTKNGGKKARAIEQYVRGERRSENSTKGSSVPRLQFQVARGRRLTSPSTTRRPQTRCRQRPLGSREDQRIQSAKLK